MTKDTLFPRVHFHQVRILHRRSLPVFTWSARMEVIRLTRVLFSLMLFLAVCTSPGIAQVNCPSFAEYRVDGCYCIKGYTINSARNGCTDINECASTHLCKGGSICVNLGGSYRCTCAPGYEVFRGPAGFQCRDLDECRDPNICASFQNQYCRNSQGSYDCRCLEGFAKREDGHCADINECDYGGWDCHVNSTCQNFIGGYNCTCMAGFLGDGRICQDVDECIHGNPCGENSQCVNNVGSYLCQCQSFDGVVIATGNCAGVHGGLQADAETATYVGIGVGVVLAALAILVIVVLLVTWKKRRGEKRPPSRIDAHLSDITIAPLEGIDNVRYENVPYHGGTDDNYITLVADPEHSSSTGSNGTAESPVDGLYSNNKIVKGKCRVPVPKKKKPKKVPTNNEERYGQVTCISAISQNEDGSAKEYNQHFAALPDTYANQTIINSTKGESKTEEDPYNTLWDKINRDLQSIKPTLKPRKNKKVDVSDSENLNGVYDRLGDIQDKRADSSGETCTYQHIYDTSEAASRL